RYDAQVQNLLDSRRGTIPLPRRGVPGRFASLTDAWVPRPHTGRRFSPASGTGESNMSSSLRLVLMAACLLSAAVPRAQPPQTEKEIAEAVRQLGDPRFAVREKASVFLRGAGRAAEAALREALKSEDNEVVRRARAILDQFKWGLFPDTPRPIAELVKQYQ